MAHGPLVSVLSCCDSFHPLEIVMGLQCSTVCEILRNSNFKTDLKPF